MDRIIKTGVLSFGMSGSLFHCPFLKIHPGFELTAIVERSVKKAIMTYPKIISYDNVDDLLAQADIELVVVNTPSSTHFEFAMKALKAKKHVLVEKPFTVKASHAKALYEEASKQNRCIMPFQNRRYDSDFLSVKHMVESGRLGQLIEVHFRYDRYRYNISDNITKESNVPGNGVLYNLGPHLVDAALALFGEPIEWTKFTGKNRPNTEVDDYAYVQLTYKNGLHVFLTTSLLVANIPPAFVLHGSKGSYTKHRCDTQERQLQSGLSPNDPNFGLEQPNQEGVLVTIDNEVSKTEKIKSVQGSYLKVFDAVYDTLIFEQPFPVTELQVVKQIEILES
ncbi:Gfo/Idh/MocA family protein [Cognatitamlana onchidii]|uniref:Gfo/Idh/MocA family protein n=1 Tax=Cognatitamlana onchidii TaxID=2562860 RepID=UPI0010A64C27|nr:Gfo/Idh/MocA family oxidoreductase [Algibacter onchidii]